MGIGTTRADGRRQLTAASATPADNPLVGPILDILRHAPAGLSEYELMRQLDSWWPPLPDDASVALFRKHFLVMNALYQLQAQLLAEEGLYLAISPLLIQLQPDPSGTGRAPGTPAPQSDAKLRDYYLDWDQLAATDRAAVDALLTGFWQRFHATDSLHAAFATLGLQPTAEWPTVVANYRRLAASTHPDRGGDAAQFLSIRAAYEQLRSCLRP